MAHDHHHPQQPSQASQHRKPGSNRSKWIFIGFLAVAGFFLLAEHRAHLYGALPFLLILACPLMHLFHGHGNHGGAHHGNNHPAIDDTPTQPSTPTHNHGRDQS